MRLRLMVLVAGLLVAGSAQTQDRFYPITYECKQLQSTTDRDGVLCTVGEFAGRPALYIKVVTKADEPDIKRDRTRYVVSVLHRNFYAEGGSQVLTRSVDKAGRTWERLCFRNGRFPNGNCNDSVLVQ